MTLNPPGNPIVLPSGGTVETLTYTIENLGPLNEADQTTVLFTLDPSIEPASAFSADPSWTCLPTTGQIQCDYFNNYTVGLVTTLELSITPPQFDVQISNAVQATLTNATSDINPGNNTINTAINFVSAGSVDLGVSKIITSGFPTTYAPGDAFSFDITVSNLSGPDATNVVVVDDLLVNSLQFDANGSSPECIDLGSFIQCSLTSLPTGDAISFTIAGTVSPSAQPGNYINTATVSANEPDPDNSNNSSDQPFTIAVGGAPEVRVTKTIVGGSTQIVQGSSFEYKVLASNYGVGNALNVDLSDTLPPEVTYQNHMDLGNFVCNFNSPVLSCNAATLPVTTAEDGVRIQVVATGPINSNVINAASTTFADSNSIDNTDSIAFTITAPSADLDITINSDANNYLVGDLITHDLTLHNPFGSTGAPTNTVVSINLSPETVFNSATETSSVGFNCFHDGAVTGGVVTCNSQGNPLPIGTNTFFTVSAFADTQTPTTNSVADVSITSDFDPNPSNDIASTIFFIGAANADLSVAFLSTSGVYNQGDTIAYSVQAVNPAGSAANPADTSLTFSLPIEVSFDSADLTNAPGWFCVHDGSPNGGLVTCDRQGTPFIAASFHDFTINVTAITPATNAIFQANINSTADSNFVNNTATQADVINAVASDFSINKTVNVTNATIGDPFTYVLTVSNDPTSTASPADVIVNDTLPAEVSYNSYVVGSNMGTSVICTHDGANTGGVFSCNTNGANFPIGEVVTIDINVTATAVNPSVTNTATVQTITDPDGTANNNTSTSSAVNISVPLTTTLSVSKVAQVGGLAVTEVTYGQMFDYVLTVTNTGGNDAIDTHVTDNLPPEVTLMGFDTTGWNCLPLNTNAINQVVDCTLATPLPATSSAIITLNVMATNNQTITSITNQTSSAGINTGALVFDSNTVNLLNSQGALNMTQSPSPVNPGDSVGFDVVFSNTGTSALTGVQLVATLPQGFIYNGFNGDPGLSCAENAGVVSCTYANPFPSNSTISLTLNLTTVANLINSPYTLQVVADAIELNTPIANNLNTVFTGGDLTLSFSSEPDQVAPGQTFTHVAQIYNSGNINLSNVSSALVFPSHAQILEVQSDDMSCSVSSAVVTCANNQTMVPGDNYTVNYSFSANNLSDLVNTSISVVADNINKSASTFTNIVSNENTFNLSLIKSATVSQSEPNAAFSYLFDIRNLGTGEQSGFSLQDQLPPGVVYQGFSGDQWSCSGSTLITCQFTGILIPGAQTQLRMDVVAPDSLGSITNTANLRALIDDDLSNNQSSVVVDVVEEVVGGSAVSDVAIDLLIDESEVNNTEEVTWYINVSNNGPNAASVVSILNDFPIGFIASEVVDDNDVSCILLTSSLMCEITSLEVNQSRQVQLKGMFSQGFLGMMLNQVEVSSESFDPDTSNNQSQAEINVIDVANLDADMAVEIQAESQQIRQGQVFEMTLVTKNNGPDKAFDAALNAEISGLISQVQILNSGQWICQSNSNSLACQFPGNYANGLHQNIDLRVVTQEVVQTSEPIIINATIESSAMDDHPANNIASASNDVGRTPTEEEIFTEFDEAIGGGASETVMNTIRNVSSYCARSYFTAIEGLCEEMIAAARPENREDIINAMEEMTPNEVIGQSTSATEMMTSQFRNISSRLSQLRGGGGSGVSVAGLTARYGNESIPLGMLAYLNQSEEEAGQVSNINDFVSPWGFFVNGNISMGERDATGRELGFDFDTYGLTAGVDYRFSPTKVAGVALGYANFDSEIEDEAEMQSTGFTLTGYGSFYIKDNFYVDARISYANPDFEQKRRINFELDNINIDRVAVGKTNANQYTAAMSMGYHFNKNSWNITPNASVRYARTTIDAFHETGAGDFNFRFGEQEVKSLVWSFGTSISKAISLKNGVLSPQFDINISRETENDGGFVEAWFINAPADEIFLIQTDEPDRTYGSAGVGLVFIGANGKQAYINYKSIFGLEGFTRGTINLGARFEF
ncbi:MAG: autotransporter domain-containing protein [Marinicella sp.]